MLILPTKLSKKFDKNKMRHFLKQENEYIIDLLNTFDVPDSVEDDQLTDMYLLDSKQAKPSNDKVSDLKHPQRAQAVDELEERLNIIKNKMKSKRNKISERGLKKREAKKLRKNKEIKKILVSATNVMKAEQAGKAGKSSGNDDTKDDKSSIVKVKPVFNEDGKIVFSKFDFAAHPGAKSKKSKKEKTVKNPRELLKKIKETDKKLNSLVESGEVDKAKEMKQELAWKKAFDKTDGKKVKDDPKLLYKAVKKRKIQKKKSKEAWKDRKEKVEQGISQRQKKREDNISKKQKEKKTRKLKRLSKKGRVIPGF